MSYKFYDKVAKKFGSYHDRDITKYRLVTECLDQDPEEVFKSKLLRLSSKDKTALDVGCADGRFVLSIASHFKEIVAIDLSVGMLASAKKWHDKKKVTNVVFEKQDAFKTTYEDESFDMVYSRRGPTPLAEAYRLLKSGGCFIEIDIGEKDCQAIKEVFNRGQNFGEWDVSRLNTVRKEAQRLGFEIVFAKDYHCIEYYPTHNDLDLFLQGVPIFEDFDSEKDRHLLEKYAAKFKTEKGIKLHRHRVVTVLKKPSLPRSK